MKKRICRECQKEFVPYTSNQKSCTLECRKISRKKYVKEYNAKKRSNKEYVEKEREYKRTNENYRKNQIEYHRKKRLEGTDWQTLNPEETKRIDNIRYHRDKEKHFLRKAAYGRKNPEYNKISKMKTYNKIYNRKLTTPSRDELRERMSMFDECIYCGSKSNPTVEHLVPTSKGGDHSLNNLFKCCNSCNASKKGTDFKTWYQKKSFYNKDRELLILELSKKEGSSNAEKCDGRKT